MTEITIPSNLKYTEDHEWIKKEGEHYLMGITDFAQKSLGDIVFVELPEEGTSFEKNESFGVVESVKSVSDLLMPIGGQVTEINNDLADQPELCNKGPYDSWMIKIEADKAEEFSELMSPEQYKKHCEE